MKFTNMTSEGNQKINRVGYTRCRLGTNQSEHDFRTHAPRASILRVDTHSPVVDDTIVSGAEQMARTSGVVDAQLR